MRSAPNPLFDGPVRTFVENLDASVYVLDNAVSHNPRWLRSAINSLSPDLIFALGADAVVHARDWRPEAPLLFAGVIDHERFGLEKLPRAMGITLQPPMFVEHMQYKMVLPHLNRLLVFYVHDAESALLDRAREAAQILQIELVAVEVASATQIPKLIDSHAKDIDAVWLPADPALTTAVTFEFLRDYTLQHKIPFAASLSDKFVRSGALMSVSTDFTALGDQAAAMAERVLLNQATPHNIGILAPIGSKLVVNFAVAEAIGLQVPPAALPFVTAVAPDPAPSEPAPAAAPAVP